MSLTQIMFILYHFTSPYDESERSLYHLVDSTWCYVEILYVSAKLPILVEPRFFCILIPLGTKPELVPFFSNASSAAILNFKMAAIFGLFWKVFVPKSYKVIYFLMIVTTYDCQTPLTTSFGSFPRIQDGRQIQNGRQFV